MLEVQLPRGGVEVGKVERTKSPRFRKSGEACPPE